MSNLAHTTRLLDCQRPTLVVNVKIYFIIIIIILLLLLLLLTAIGLSPGGSGYFTCIQIMKLVTNIFNSGGLNQKHLVATWCLGNHLSICL